MMGVATFFYTFVFHNKEALQLIDTHTHIYLPEFDSDRDEVVAKAVEEGVDKLLMPNIDLSSLRIMNEAAGRYPGICYPMIGLHPTSVKDDWRSQLDTLKEYALKGKYIAVGEIGIDLYWDKSFIREQLIAFREQLELAISLDLPAVIHSRDATPEIYSVLDDFRNTALRGVFHAFSGDADAARRALNSGFRLGIGGIVTFKNSGLDNVVKSVGIDNLILETDSPYLAPAPHRGKRNESSYITLINSKIAGIFGMDEDEAADITTANAKKLFRLN